MEKQNNKVKFVSTIHKIIIKLHKTIIKLVQLVFDHLMHF